MMNKKPVAPPTYDEAMAWLREHGFEILEPPGTQHRAFVRKYNCSAAIEKDSADERVKIFARPGYLVSGEISKLVDKGYQKFLKTSKLEVPATADHLKALHEFTEELKESFGGGSLYNESLGTVSDSYHYDRVEHRDEPMSSRPKPPWQDKSKAVKPPPARKKPA